MLLTRIVGRKSYGCTCVWDETMVQDYDRWPRQSMFEKHYVATLISTQSFEGGVEACLQFAELNFLLRTHVGHKMSQLIEQKTVQIFKYKLAASGVCIRSFYGSIHPMQGNNG